MWTWLLRFPLTASAVQCLVPGGLGCQVLNAIVRFVVSGLTFYSTFVMREQLDESRNKVGVAPRKCPDKQSRSEVKSTPLKIMEADGVHSLRTLANVIMADVIMLPSRTKQQQRDAT